MSCLQNELILESIFEEAQGLSVFKWRETDRNSYKKNLRTWHNEY